MERAAPATFITLRSQIFVTSLSETSSMLSEPIPSRQPVRPFHGLRSKPSCLRRTDLCVPRVHRGGRSVRAPPLRSEQALKRLLVELGGHIFTSDGFRAALAASVEFVVFGLRLHDGAGRQIIQLVKHCPDPLLEVGQWVGPGDLCGAARRLSVVVPPRIGSTGVSFGSQRRSCLGSQRTEARSIPIFGSRLRPTS